MSQAQGGARPTKVVDLAQVSIPRLVFALLHQRFTGVLQVPQPGDDDAPRTVWFSGGMPVFTDWHEPSDMLGQILVGGGVMGDPELYDALQHAAASGQRLGEVLVAQGRLTPDQLSEALRRQCSRKLSHLFALRDGPVEVTPEHHTVGDDDGLVKLNVLELIHAAVGLYYDEDRVAAEMGDALEAPLRATAALSKYASHFHFRPADQSILQSLANGTDMGRLCAMPAVTRRRAAQLVYTLWACQMLHVGVAAQSTPEPSAAAPAAPRARATTAPFVQGVGAPPSANRDTSARPVVSAAPVPVTSEDESVPARSARSRTQPEPAAPRRPRSHTQTDLGSADHPAAEPHHDAAQDEPFEVQLARVEAMVSGGAHAFALFRLPLDATKKQVRHAWGELSRTFHPDALASRGLSHLRERVSTVFAALSEAHQVLGDADDRDKLRAQIESGDFGKPKSDETARVRAALEAELIAKEADKLLRANRFDRALERYRDAIALTEEEPDIRAAVAWCEFQLSRKTPEDHSRANARLAKILEEAPNIARAHYFRGFVLAGLGQEAMAIDAFTRAHAQDSRLIDAERQARALRMRRSSPSPAASKGKGLRGFFGKK